MGQTHPGGSREPKQHDGAAIIHPGNEENGMRRILAVWFMMAALCGAAQAQSMDACTTAGENNAWLGITTIRLWQGDAPEAKGNACKDIPTLTIFVPQPGHGNGSAVVVVPGGAYMGLAGDLEGRQV